MLEFNSTLLREKFSILDSSLDQEEETAIIALSNRLVVSLKSKNAEHTETFVIRTQNMHSCVRMAARMLKSHRTGGPIMTRAKPYDWEASWDAIVNDYEYRFNEDRWVAIYYQGKVVFEEGERHIFLDVIEKCDAQNKGAYEASIPMAEQAFKQTGKVVKINHDSNVALVIDLETYAGKFGVIVRGPTKTTTFNFSVAPRNKKEPLNFAQCIAACACYLEGVQLAFMLGMNHEKLRLGIIERFSKEEKQTREAGQRLGRLNAEIANLERTYIVNYRPEKPDFQQVLMDAERLAQRVIKVPEDEYGADREEPEGDDEQNVENVEQPEE